MEAEAIVVGAGPAGSTAARELAARGVEVLLLDRARFPRDKPCGGGVTIRCDSLLPFSLEPVIEDVVSGAVIQLRDGRKVTREHDSPLTYMTQRSRLDHFLVERAQEAGVEFRDGQRVRHVQRLADRSLEVAVGSVAVGNGANGAAPERHYAQAVIGADGANGIVGTSLGYEHAEESAVALEGNFPFPDGVPEWLRGHVALQFGVMRGGYGWLFPKGDHVNVGVGGWKAAVGGDLRPQLHALCRSYDLDPERLEMLRGHHLPMLRRGSVLAAGGSALIGDAAGLVDPLSGEGIYAAIASGGAVASVVHDYMRGTVDSLTRYQQAVERELLPDVAASHALMELFHLYPPPFVWALQRSDRVWRHCALLIRGEEGYADIVGSAGPLAHVLRPLEAAARAITKRRYGRPRA